MHCILHIGLEKTGTTTIQNFLNDNRDQLYGYGYFYSKAMGEPDNRRLGVAAYNQDRRDDYTRRKKLNSNMDLLAHQQHIVDELNKEVRNIEQDSVIFSSEQLQSRLTTVDEVKRLKKILSGAGITSFRVVIYLRRPADLANSNYSTWIRCGSTDPAPPRPTHPKFQTLCNHKNTLQLWESVFGRESLHPRLLDPSFLKDSSLLKDFVSVIGCDWASSFVVPSSQNEALTPVALEVLRRINREIPVFDDQGPNALRGDIVQYFNRFFTAGKGDKYVMPYQSYIEYDKAFAESDNWVKERWFPGRDSLFKQGAPRAKLTNSTPDYELDAWAGIISTLWIEKRELERELSTRDSSRYMAKALGRKILDKFRLVWQHK
jgi:hypothetical protein